MEAVLTLQCAQDPLYYLKYIANEAFIEGRKEKKKKEKKKSLSLSFFPPITKEAKMSFKPSTQERVPVGGSAPPCGWYAASSTGHNFRLSLELGEQTPHGQENQCLPLTAHAETSPRDAARCTGPPVPHLAQGKSGPSVTSDSLEGTASEALTLWHHLNRNTGRQASAD